MTIVEQIKKSVHKKICLLNQSGIEQELHIGFGINALYARSMGVVMTSIAVNNPQVRIIFHVLASSIDDEDTERLKLLVRTYPNISLNLYHVDETVISHLPVMKRFPLAMYFRLMLPLILEDTERILYLDSDIICLNDISQLTDIALNDFVCAAVPDLKYVREQKGVEFGLTTKKYFNSGVLLINIPKWNEQQISEKVISFLASSQRCLALPDQDALNVILEEKVFHLPSRWNCLPDEYRAHAAENSGFAQDIVFLHCTFYPKPWSAACINPLQSYYLDYERRSPWSAQPLIPPATYREARFYSSLLFKKGNVMGAVNWYVKYVGMKMDAKLFAN